MASLHLHAKTYEYCKVLQERGIEPPDISLAGGDAVKNKVGANEMDNIPFGAIAMYNYADKLGCGLQQFMAGARRFKLSEIVRDIVDVSMIDGRTIDLVSRHVDINVLVMRAVSNVEQFIHQREQVLSLNMADDLPLIRCDFERIVQAVGNVLSNAIKFTPDKGRIIIETKLVHRPRPPEKFASVGADRSCTLSNEQIPYVEIAIHDSGIGIAEAEQEAIFDKFYEVGDVEEHSTGKVAFKSRGAGLGLSIVKGIIDLHGGAVWVESPGYDPDIMPGSTFYLLLPAADPIA